MTSVGRQPSPRRRLEMKIAILIEPCEQGGYTASTPSLPGHLSRGATIDETMIGIREALERRLRLDACPPRLSLHPAAGEPRRQVGRFGLLDIRLTWRDARP